jgi:hypothetical protein
MDSPLDHIEAMLVTRGPANISSQRTSMACTRLGGDENVESRRSSQPYDSPPWLERYRSLSLNENPLGALAPIPRR